MTDDTSRPHGPERLPDEQPSANPTDLSNQTALQSGATSRWLVPSGVLTVIAIALYAWAFTLQAILPVIGIVYVATMFIVMVVVARRRGDARRRNVRLAWYMGALAVGALIVFLGIYAVEILRVAPD
jgi:hypothetical protein